MEVVCPALASFFRCSRLAAELKAVDLALHDAQSVIAREHGLASWTALREEVEARTLSFDAAVEEFVRCATGGASGRAERLLNDRLVSGCTPRLAPHGHV
jgi:hypothetical protein